MGGQALTTKILTANANPTLNSKLKPSSTFLKDLITSLNTHLQYPIIPTENSPQDISVLIESLRLLTHHYFTETFTYPFSLTAPRPPFLSKPCYPLALSELVSCPVHSPSLINGYILTHGLSSPDSIPRAYGRRVAADLYAAIKKCLDSKEKRGEWKVERYHRVYEEKLGILSNYAVDAVWIWTVVEAVDWRRRDEPVKGDILLLSYAGVGYNTKAMGTLA